MSPAGDICVSLGPVSNRDIGQLEIQFVSAEQQIEIAERVEIAEIRAVGRDLRVVLSEPRLGSARMPSATSTRSSAVLSTSTARM